MNGTSKGVIGFVLGALAATVVMLAAKPENREKLADVGGKAADAVKSAHEKYIKRTPRPDA